MVDTTNGPLPELILPHLYKLVLDHEVSSEQAIELASSVELADIATETSCKNLAAACLFARLSDGASSAVLADLVASHAAAICLAGRAKEAIILYDAILPIMRRFAHASSYRIGLQHAAQTRYQVGDYAQALADCNSAIVLYGTDDRHDEVPLLVDRARCLMTRAKCLRQLGRPEEALTDYETAIQLFSDVSPPQELLQADVAICRMNNGNVLQDLGRHAEALGYYDNALPMLELFGMESDLRICRSNRDIALLRLMSQAASLCATGNYRQAIESFDTVLARPPLDGFEFERALGHFGRATCRRELGRYDEALEDYDAALQIGQPSTTVSDENVRRHVATTHKWRGITLGKCGRFSEALSGLEAALAFFEKRGPESEAAYCRMHKGITLCKLSRFDEAADSYDAAIRFFRPHGSALELARCQMHSVVSLLAVGRIGEAISRSEAALGVLEDDGSSTTRGRSYMACGKARHLMADAEDDATRKLAHYEKALAKYESALPHFDRHGPPTEWARCQLSIAIVCVKLGRDVEADAHSKQIDENALPLSERHLYFGLMAHLVGTRDENGGALAHLMNAKNAARDAQRIGRCDEMSLEFVVQRRNTVREFVRVALDQEKYYDAFAGVQEGKASVFSTFGDRRNGERCDEAPEFQRARERVVAALRNRVDEQEVGQCKAAYIKAWERFGKSNANEAANVQTPPDALPLTTIQNALPQGWAIIELWHVKEDQCAAFVVTSDELHVEQLTFPLSSNAMMNRCQAFVESWHSPDGRYDALLDILYLYVFAPLRKWLNDRCISGLYLVPHRFFHGLPLHMARRHVNGRNVYLCEEFKMSYLPSASTLPRLPPPNVGRASPNGSANDAGLQAGCRLFSMSNPDRGTHQSLPFADWEGRMLGSAFSRADGRPISGAEATYAAIASWGNANLLHFACHGTGVGTFAPFSHLRLADDLLLAHDIVYRCQPLRPGALVILNGCETAIPDWRAIDEGLGLMNAFLLRGASAVLATQRIVDDHCAAEMVLSFVRELLAGGSPAECLQTAHDDVRRLTTEDVLARLAEVRAVFPAELFPHEAAQLHVQTARAYQTAGKITDARDQSNSAAELLRKLGRSGEARRVEAIGTQPVGSNVGRGGQDGPFDHPFFWSAFQLVGRVT